MVLFYSKYTYEFIEEELYEGNIGKEKYYNPNNDSEILNFTDLILDYYSLIFKI